jgi:hypothetical protein
MLNSQDQPAAIRIPSINWSKPVQQCDTMRHAGTVSKPKYVNIITKGEI